MIRLSTVRTRILFAVTLVASMAGASLLYARASERYTAQAVNLGDAPVRWTTLTVEMTIDRWSTDGERDRLYKVLVESGQQKLLSVLQDMPRVGYIRTPDSIGYDLKFARKMPGEDGGERVVLATDRYITFWEAVNRPRTIDYPFTVIELRIGADGKGEGKMSLFTKIGVEKRTNTIVLENYGTQPVLLQSVRKETDAR
jgi:hypothetical protein